MMKVLVTGHLGYIGVHLVDVLKSAGTRVTGCDLGLFAGCEWEPFVRPDRELIKDVGELTERRYRGPRRDLPSGGDQQRPDGRPRPRGDARASTAITRSNWLARPSGRGSIDSLFSGSCSVYGGGEKLDLEETDPLNPLTPYARARSKRKNCISELADDDFTPVYLRNATAYGDSPMLRVDLVVNNLLGSALSYGEIRIMSDGSPWRPLIHCRDIARAFVAFPRRRPRRRFTTKR